LCTSKIFAKYVRPRAYLLEKVDHFFEERLSGTYNIGLHVRGTDAVSFRERRAHRIGSLSFRQYVKFIEQMIRKRPDSRIFVATDTEKAVRYLTKRFGDRVVAYDALRHDGGSVAGSGPAGGMLPAYIAGDRDGAARNGEEAVIDYLLLSRCDLLVHNSSGLARTVLLANATIPHFNTHLNRKLLVSTLKFLQRIQQSYQRWRGEVDPYQERPHAVERVEVADSHDERSVAHSERPRHD
jgi:hypothetical protein